MAWKLFFGLGNILYIALLISGLVYFNYILPYMDEIGYLQSLFITIMMIVGLSYFYALGWNKRLYSKRVHSIFVVFLIIAIISTIVSNVYQFYSFSLYLKTPTDFLNKAVGIFAGVCTFILLVIFSPLFVAMIKYKNRIDELNFTDNQFWKFIAYFATLNSIAFIIATLCFNLNHVITMYNTWDFYIILICFYESAFLIGYAFKKKIFNQLFWRISSIVYVLFLVPSYLFMSQQFKFDFMYLDLWSFRIITAILNALYIYILCRYSFTKAIFNKEK